MLSWDGMDIEPRNKGQGDVPENRCQKTLDVVQCWSAIQLREGGWAKIYHDG